MEFNNNKSIFLQIADSLTDQIANGLLAPGEKIPSVRELAADMGVNPNTIMRTYNELQSADIIENKRGIGYFVNVEARNKIMERKKEEFFRDVLPGFIKQASLLGITSSDLKKHLEQLNS
ncbi:MAG: GntR family transcriptional regulator [Flavobacterium psychrophilum]|nr:MAG: GntR family transcriptional regulator [Flavobacterium psychrophilum]